MPLALQVLSIEERTVDTVVMKEETGEHLALMREAGRVYALLMGGESGEDLGEIRKERGVYIVRM